MDNIKKKPSPWHTTSHKEEQVEQFHQKLEEAAQHERDVFSTEDFPANISVPSPSEQDNMKEMATRFLTKELTAAKKMENGKRLQNIGNGITKASNYIGTASSVTGLVDPTPASLAAGVTAQIGKLTGNLIGRKGEHSIQKGRTNYMELRHSETLEKGIEDAQNRIEGLRSQMPGLRGDKRTVVIYQIEKELELIQRYERMKRESADSVTYLHKGRATEKAIEKRRNIHLMYEDFLADLNDAQRQAESPSNLSRKKIRDTIKKAAQISGGITETSGNVLGIAAQAAAELIPGAAPALETASGIAGWASSLEDPVNSGVHAFTSERPAASQRNTQAFKTTLRRYLDKLPEDQQELFNDYVGSIERLKINKFGMEELNKKMAVLLRAKGSRQSASPATEAELRNLQDESIRIREETALLHEEINRIEEEFRIAGEVQRGSIDDFFEEASSTERSSTASLMASPSDEESEETVLTHSSSMPDLLDKDAVEEEGGSSVEVSGEEPTLAELVESTPSEIEISSPTSPDIFSAIDNTKKEMELIQLELDILDKLIEKNGRAEEDKSYQKLAAIGNNEEGLRDLKALKENRMQTLKAALEEYEKLV